MNNDVWLQITAGQGPKECGWVVARVCRRMIEDATCKRIDACIVESLAYEKNLRNQDLVLPDAFRSVLLHIKGELAQHFADEWCGGIRWQGESPFRPRHKRTSWYVKVINAGRIAPRPTVDSQLERDVEYQFVKSGGPGGQHVNKSNSAVRLTHKPTGIQVRVDASRSQHRNREFALQRLQLILCDEESAAHQDLVQKRWLSHYQVERGNPKKIFSDVEFKEI